MSASRTVSTTFVATVAAFALGGCGVRDEGAAGALPAPPTSAAETGESTPRVTDPPASEDRATTDYLPATRAELDAVINDPSARRTVALGRGGDGEVGWWMTVWSSTSPRGVATYCLGHPGGLACSGDGHGIDGPVALDIVATNPPYGVSFFVDPTVVQLTATLDGGEPFDVAPTDIGVPSGMRVAGIPFTTVRPSEIVMTAVLDNGQVIDVSVSLPPVEEEAAALAGAMNEAGIEEFTVQVADPSRVPYGPRELEE